MLVIRQVELQEVLGSVLANEFLELEQQRLVGLGRAGYPDDLGGRSRSSKNCTSHRCRSNLIEA